MPERMPEDMSDRIPEDMPDRMPEDMSGRMSDRRPDRMPEDMPEDMPDRMPDRMPEDLPVRKSINVMVGITRSKVIFLTAPKQPVCRANTYISIYNKVIIYYEIMR